MALEPEPLSSTLLLPKSISLVAMVPQRFHDNTEERDPFVAGQYLWVAISLHPCQHLLVSSLFLFFGFNYCHLGGKKWYLVVLFVFIPK